MGLLSGAGGGAFKSADRTNFTATAGQTTFTLTQGYSIGDVDVFLNGVKLLEGDDYYATNGSTVVLTSGAVAGDFVQVISYNQFSVANAYTKTETDSRYMVASGSNPMTSYLRTPNYGVSSWSDTATASLEASVGAGETGVGVKAFGRSIATTGGNIHYITDTRGAGGAHKFYSWNGSVTTTLGGFDSAGRFTIPNQPAFQISLNATNTGPKTLEFNTSRVNVGGVFNTSTYRFTAPVSGTYWFHYHDNHTGAAGALYADFYKNGSFIGYGRMYSQHTGTGWEELSGTIVATMSVGDYMQVYLQSAHGADSNNYSSFCGGLIG